MARIRCGKCGRKYGSSAQGCPHCGTSSGRPRGTDSLGDPQRIGAKGLLAVAAAMLFALTAYLAYRWCGEPPRDGSSSAPAGSVKTGESLRPKTLDDLLALGTAELERVDIGRINLLCAVGLRGSENLDVEECVRTLDA